MREGYGGSNPLNDRRLVAPPGFGSRVVPMTGRILSIWVLALALCIAPPVAAGEPSQLPQRVEPNLKLGRPVTRLRLVVPTEDAREPVAIALESRFVSPPNTKMLTTAAAYAALYHRHEPLRAGGAAV